jgi:hypothetical protein
MSNNNLYRNQFVNTREQPFQSNEERFKNFMQQKNQDVLNQQRLPNQNLKTELVTPKKKDSKKKINKEQKIRSTVLNINSANRVTSNQNVVTNIKNLGNNPLQISNGSNQLLINVPNHNLKNGSEVEILGITNEYTSSNIFSFQGGDISSCGTGFNGVINTSIAHGLSINSNLLISKTNCYPTINKEVTVTSVPSSTQFTINTSINTINDGSGIWGGKEATVNLTDHGLNVNSNVTISNVADDVTLGSNPLNLSLTPPNAHLTITYNNHPFNIDDKITLSNASKEISLGTQPIFLKLPVAPETISDIEITTPDTTHKIKNKDRITLSNAEVNHLLDDNSLRTLGGTVSNLSHTTGTVTVTTSSQHHLQVGNTVYFFNTSTVPTINDTGYTITEIVDNTNFKFSKSLKNIIKTIGDYGTKIINVSHSITNANSFITNKKINLLGIEDNLISNNLNNSYTILNSTMVNTTDKFQIDASNVFTNSYLKVTEQFGSNINIGSIYIDSSSIALSTINNNFDVISGGLSSTLVIASDSISNLDKTYTIGGTNSKIISNNILSNFNVDDINTTHTIISTNTNDFTVSLGTTSVTNSITFGGSNVILNKYVGVSNKNLNKTHLVKSVVDSNNFKIELGAFSQTNYSSVGGDNINLSLDTINNLNLNLINSKEPRDNEHINRAQSIQIIDENNLRILFNSNFTIDKTFGGNNITLGIIIGYKQGYPNQNNYVVELDRKYENIYQIALISSEFVNSEQIIKGSSFGSLQNNLIKIKLEGSSSLMDSQNLIDGNYDANTFSRMVATELSKITSDLGNPVFECNTSIDTGKLTLKCFLKTNLSKPFSVSQDSNILTVTHNNHGFLSGQVIKILNSSNADTIVSTDINELEHIITVIDSNTYQFTVNSTSQRTSTARGGKTVQVLKPHNFKLLFSEANTAFKLFGFIDQDTDFAVEHTGTELVDLSGDDYFYMCSPQLSDTVKDDGTVKDIYAKILLNQSPGNILYDTFVSNPKIFFDTPLKFLDRIEFIFREPNNNLFFMNNLNHSFSLRIDEVIEIIENTNFSSRTGNFN